MIALDRVLLMALELDYDQVVKLSEQERKKVLKAAYHKLAQKYHPDKWSKDSGMTQKEMEEKFKQVHHCYQSMTDPTYRQRIANKGQVNLNAVININLTFTQAFFGNETTITFNPTNIDSDGMPETIDVSKDVTMEVEVVRVVIPANTRSGDRLVIPKRGLKQGDQRGDMVFMFNVKPHEKFQLHHEENNHVISYESVPLETLLAGGDIEVSTMWGLKTFSISPGSSPKDSITLRKLGPNQDGRHTIYLDMIYPTKDDVKKSNVWQKLGIQWNEGVHDESLDEEEKEFEAIFQRLGGFRPWSPPQTDQTEF